MESRRYRQFFAGMSIILAGLLLTWAVQSQGQPLAPQPPEPASWEYKFVETPTYLGESEKAYNDLGSEGWEYCETRNQMKIGENKQIMQVHASLFKRKTRAAVQAR